MKYLYSLIILLFPILLFSQTVYDVEYTPVCWTKTDGSTENILATNWNIRSAQQINPIAPRYYQFAVNAIVPITPTGGTIDIGNCPIPPSPDTTYQTNLIPVCLDTGTDTIQAFVEVQRINNVQVGISAIVDETLQSVTGVILSNKDCISGLYEPIYSKLDSIFNQLEENDLDTTYIIKYSYVCASGENYLRKEYFLDHDFQFEKFYHDNTTEVPAPLLYDLGKCEITKVSFNVCYDDSINRVHVLNYDELTKYPLFDVLDVDGESAILPAFNKVEIGECKDSEIQPTGKSCYKKNTELRDVYLNYTDEKENVTFPLTKRMQNNKGGTEDGLIKVNTEHCGQEPFGGRPIAEASLGNQLLTNSFFETVYKNNVASYETCVTSCTILDEFILFISDIDSLTSSDTLVVYKDNYSVFDSHEWITGNGSIIDSLDMIFFVSDQDNSELKITWYNKNSFCFKFEIRQKSTGGVATPFYGAIYHDKVNQYLDNNGEYSYIDNFTNLEVDTNDITCREILCDLSLVSEMEVLPDTCLIGPECWRYPGDKEICDYNMFLTLGGAWRIISINTELETIPLRYPYEVQDSLQIVQLKDDLECWLNCMGIVYNAVNLVYSQANGVNTITLDIIGTDHVFLSLDHATNLTPPIYQDKLFTQSNCTMIDGYVDFDLYRNCAGNPIIRIDEAGNIIPEQVGEFRVDCPVENTKDCFTKPSEVVETCDTIYQKIDICVEDQYSGYFYQGIDCDGNIVVDKEALCDNIVDCTLSSDKSIVYYDTGAPGGSGIGQLSVNGNIVTFNLQFGASISQAEIDQLTDFYNSCTPGQSSVFINPEFTSSNNGFAPAISFLPENVTFFSLTATQFLISFTYEEVTNLDACSVDKNNFTQGQTNIAPNNGAYSFGWDNYDQVTTPIAYTGGYSLEFNCRTYNPITDCVDYKLGECCCDTRIFCDCSNINETYSITGTQTYTVLASEVCNYSVTVESGSVTINGIEIKTGMSNGNGTECVKLTNNVAITGLNSSTYAVIEITK